MVFKINNVDYSAYIQHKTDVIETPRYIDGANAGVSINGTAIYDRVATKYDLQVIMKPLPQDMVYALLTVMEDETVTIEYTSFRSDTTRTMVARPSASSVSYATTNGGARIYAGSVMTFEEK